ncbi:Phosphatidylinositol 4,5-bisphosphate-binding protein SLM1 [Paramyrothecium foliicola]|nr:Phosphatidylinositol 4,5-bisphosphate-binding protein SLM1 [Paramyrothecium foliicola]
MDPSNQTQAGSQSQSSSYRSNDNSHLQPQLHHQSAQGTQHHNNQYHGSNSAANNNHPYQQNNRIPTNVRDNSSIVAPQPQSHHLQAPFAGRFTEEWDASQRGSSIIDGHHGKMQRSASVRSFNPGDDQQQITLPSRGNTLKKRSSSRRSASLGRSASRRSMKAGSVRSLALNSASDPDEGHSAFFCPIPTSGNPTEVLANRFQTWRKILKDLIAYFREIQAHYETRSKSLIKLANVSNNISTPPGFLASGGVDDALQFLRNYNKNAVLEANKSREIEEDVILALTGLRSDLQQKIKEIKHLSGDFKNSVDKEMDSTGKAVKALADVLGKTEVDAASTTGKQDPFLLRLAVDRQVERQIDEENYLHQAYLNLESSGRELESIVVGEIQKAYNAYAGILKREADNAYGVIEELREGPISMPKDQEWTHFVTHDDQFVDPSIPLRSPDQIHYPGQDHISAQEIRAGLLERKSKYLKSYTAGWYVLSTTHLHEFKSADKAQAPVMSLYLPDQKLGSHSTEGGSSNKFILKGRQTGSMHRGHTWVFRAESHDTMMAWYEDIKALTEKSPEERSQFVRSHSRSLSQSSRRSASSDGLDEDEEDEEPFSAGSQIDVNPGPRPDALSRRSQQPGGRFPSDIQVNAQRGLQAPHSPSSVSSGVQEPQHTDPQVIAGAGALTGAAAAGYHHDQADGDENYTLGYGGTGGATMDSMPSQAAIANHEAQHDGVNPYTSEPVPQQSQPTYHHEDATYIVPVVAAAQPYQQPHANEFDETNNSRNPGLEQEHAMAGGLNNGEVLASEAPQAYMNGDAQPLNGSAGGNNVNMLAVNAAGFPKSESAHEAEALAVPEMEADVPPVSATTATDDDSLWSRETPVRPTKNNVRNDSVATISNLHIPGGYPKSTIAESS